MRTAPALGKGLPWRSLPVAVLLLAAGCIEPGPGADALPPPQGKEDLALALSGLPRPAPWGPGLHDYAVTVDGQDASGLLAVPDGPPTTLVVVAHGWGGDAAQHRDDLATLADAGAVAVAMDYRGPRTAFKVRTGVEDTVAATLDLQARLPAVDRTLVYGWSMGGEVALLAVATAPPGTYDYAFVGAGVSDLEAFWHENPLARPDVEREAGGPPVQDAGPYAHRSPLARVGDVARGGLARVFLLHGAADGVVPIEHAERMSGALQGAGVPTSYYVVTRDKATLCLAAGCVEVAGPADHFAGRMQPMLPFLLHRIDRAPDPVEPFLRGTYDAEAGTYEPSDTRP